MSDPRQEAIKWLNCMFQIPEGYSSDMIALIVDNIIKATVAEMKATTEESSADHLRDAMKKMEVQR